MEWDIRSLDFEFLPTPVEFWMYLYDRYELYFGVTQECGVKTYTDYIKFLNEPLEEKHGELLGFRVDVIDSSVDNKTYIYFSKDHRCYGFEKGKERLEDLLNKAIDHNYRISIKR